MYINCQQNRVKTSVITVHTNIFPKKIASCIKLQLDKLRLSGIHYPLTDNHADF